MKIKHNFTKSTGCSKSRGKFKVIVVYLKKQEKSQVSNLTYHLRKSAKEKQKKRKTKEKQRKQKKNKKEKNKRKKKTKEKQKKEKTKIRADINEIDVRK